MNLAGPTPEHGRVLQDMQRWLERAVIGLNLCPFAKSVHVRGLVHWAVCDAPTAQILQDELVRELEALVALTPAARDTTLLVVARGMQDFFEFNLFLTETNRILKRLGLKGVVQIASFHPQFQFAGAAADDIANFTNRAPYPTIHLLRESSISRAVEVFPHAEVIFDNNIQTLQHLGHAGWDKLGVGRTTPDDSEEDA